MGSRCDGNCHRVHCDNLSVNPVLASYAEVSGDWRHADSDAIQPSSRSTKWFYYDLSMLKFQEREVDGPLINRFGLSSVGIKALEVQHVIMHWSSSFGWDCLD